VTPAQPTLHTPRLLLRPLAMDDAAQIQALASDPAIAATTSTLPHPYHLEHAQGWIEGIAPAFAEGKRMSLAITCEGAIVGVMSLAGISRTHRRAALGYWIGVPFWGRGYATEAAQAILAYGFAELGLHRIYGECYRHNPASERVLQKLGMRFEGCQRGAMKKGDAFIDILLYALLEPDFRR
jgi:ribosomal-protein-alanine N-acetyltransferase